MSMEDLACRFASLQCRFVQFSEQAHTVLREWLSRQLVNSLEISLDNLTECLFRVTCPAGIPQQWLKTIARCALEDQLSCVPNVRYGGSGASVVFTDISSTRFAVWPSYSRTCVVTQSPGNRDTVVASSSLREKNSILEVKVRELEAKIFALERLPRQPLPYTLAPCLPFYAANNNNYYHGDTTSSCCSFLMEKRFEAEDAISTLRRVQDEFVERKRVLDMLGGDQTQRFAERRRADQKKARRELALATDEIVRLRAEVERLDSINKDSSASSLSTCADAKKEPDHPIVPRRALKIAGFWDVQHNDILLVTPHLVKRFESVVGEGGIIRPKNNMMQVCFPAKDQKVLIDVVVEVMTEFLPQYARAGVI
jgi:hypothetical protein